MGADAQSTATTNSDETEKRKAEVRNRRNRVRSWICTFLNEGMARPRIVPLKCEECGAPLKVPPLKVPDTFREVTG